LFIGGGQASAGLQSFLINCKKNWSMVQIPHQGHQKHYVPGEINLVILAGDSEGCVGKDKDAWETFDGPLNMLLQKPQKELQYLVWVGEKELIGLCCPSEYLVVHHNINRGLLEGKVSHLILTIDEV
jgi:hypothetical protein